MRRVLALLAALAATAVAVGLAASPSSASAISVDGASISQSQFSRQLQVVADHPLYQCFLAAKSYVSTPSGASALVPAIEGSRGTWTSGAVVEWTDLQVTRLVAERADAAHGIAVVVPPATTSAELAATGLGRSLAAQINSLELQAQQLQSGYSCRAAGTITDPGTATLLSLPAWFLREQLQGLAATLALSKISPQQPTTTAALRRYYDGHVAAYDTLCASGLIVADQPMADKVIRELTAGSLTISEAAKNPKLDTDPSQVADGGKIGCYSPSSPSYASVQHYLGSLAVGAPTSLPEQTGVLVVEVTSRTHNPFGTVRGAVAAQLRAENAGAVAGYLVGLQRASRITVAPHLGRWETNALGGTLVPFSPPLAAVTNPTADTSS